MGGGGTIKNLDQKTLGLSDASVDRDLSSIFQIAAVTRPLMNVVKICDAGPKSADFTAPHVVCAWLR